MKKLFIVLFTVLSLIIPNSLAAQENSKVVDEIGLLDNNQIAEIEVYLSQCADKHNINLAFYVTDENPEIDISRQAAEKFESLGYQEGFLFELNFGVSEYEIICMGDSQKLSGYLSEALDVVYNDIVNKDYVRANRSFADFIDFAFEDYANPQNGPSTNYQRRSMSIGSKLLIACGIAGIITLITLIILKKQLRTEGMKNNANNYEKPYSFNITRAQDLFLYRETHRRRIERNNNIKVSSGHGGGSFTSGHTSSGHSYSGGGGHKF